MTAGFAMVNEAQRTLCSERKWCFEHDGAAYTIAYQPVGEVVVNGMAVTPRFVSVPERP